MTPSDETGLGGALTSVAQNPTTDPRRRNGEATTHWIRVRTRADRVKRKHLDVEFNP